MTTFADGENGLSVRTKINDVLQHMDGTAGTLVVNEAGADVDFRVESDTDVNAIYMDGATGRVGLGTGTPTTKLSVYAPNTLVSGSVTKTAVIFDMRTAATGTGGSIALGGYYSGTSLATEELSVVSGIKENNTAGDYASALTFLTRLNGGAPTERMRISSAGNVGIGTLSPTAKLQVDDSFLSKNTMVSIVATGISGGASGPSHGLYMNIGASDNTSVLYGVYSEINYIGVQPNYAGYFAARGTYAPVYGVYGKATQLDLNGPAIAYGGYFQSAAINPGGLGDTYAVRAENIAVSGRAAYGLSVSTLAGAATVLPFQILHAGTERLRFDSSGRLLIGTTVASGANLLQVNSDARINTLTLGLGAGSVASNTALGANTLFANTTGNTNTAVGFYALSSSTTATSNVAVGAQALINVTTGGGNICIGRDAGSLITTGTSNTIIGQIGGTAGLVDTVIIGAGLTERMRIDSSGRMLIGTTTSSGTSLLQVNGDALVNGVTVGKGAGAISDNTAVGTNALATNTTGASNTAVGISAVRFNTTGSANTAVGYAALNANTTASGNTAVGYLALSASTGANNTALGRDALVNNTTGASNVAIGQATLVANITGGANTAVGANALNANTGSNNTAVGFTSLYTNGAGANNTAVGLNSLNLNTTGSGNTAIGHNAGSALTTGDNNTIIGRVNGTAGLANTVIIAAGTTERLRIDASGNMGLGVTPLGSTNWNGIDLGSAAFKGSISSFVGNAQTAVTSNAYNNNTNWIYNATGLAAQYICSGVGGEHRWLNAPSGTAGNAITFTQAMTLTAAGSLGIGATSPESRVQVISNNADTNFLNKSSPSSTSGLQISNYNFGVGIFSALSLETSSSSQIQSASIIVQSVSAGVTPNLIFTARSGGGTTNAERMRIDSAGNVGIGTNAPNAAAILDVQSTTKGVRFPNMTTTEKNAIANVAGNVIFDTTLGKLCVNTGSGWQTITSA